MSNLFPSSRPVKKQTLAEQIATQIKDAILAGEWQAGDALPTEPELAKGFGVSRAVVRDATRMLAARGLVEAHHGRGVFVTTSQAEAFGDALLLALRREGATVWDVEQFQQMILPEVYALAAVEATAADRRRVADAAQAYLAYYAQTVKITEGEEDAEARAKIRSLFAAFMTAVFDATHNKLWKLLAAPLLSLRNVRYWEETEHDTPETRVARESAAIQAIAMAVVDGDPAAARLVVRQVTELPEEAVAAMRNTRVGDVPRIKRA